MRRDPKWLKEQASKMLKLAKEIEDERYTKIGKLVALKIEDLKVGETQDLIAEIEPLLK